MIDTTEFNTRLKNILDYYGLTASGFADIIKVQRSSISHILSGRNKPSLEFISKVLSAFPEVDLTLFLNGTGEFPKSTTPLPKTELKPITSNPTEVSSTEDDLIDRIVIFYKDGRFKNYSSNTVK
jgi:transcriptional regulator with XRE-family HTH domain